MNVEPWSTISEGASGPVVKGAQYLLRAKGHTIAADGAFGPLTRAAVIAQQTTAGVPADGVVGPLTWPHLVTPVSQGSTGDAVRAVQQFGLLRSPGDTALVPDGSFGPITKEHVEFFQESWGLSLDGAAGRETWSFLSTAVPGPRPWPLVKQGSTQATNWRVLAAQHLLRAHGATIAADGVFGPASGAATIAFQQTLRAVEISSTIGQLDWPSLIVTVRLGDHGEAVKALQTLLAGELTVDGDFGPLTDAAVRSFQDVFAPPSDGIVGPVTWWSLVVRLFD
ncbi:peptidoglycan-binding protein [Microbacterium sp. SS28]|uniref:peptidoglycan-binding domain-containing protein n=1 Tax=Microbacterium sp. SS28 TaxID=2919948 RepID=UPI001FAA2FF2|nr:peptidoglycan-binding protein [Microbacterium sp. SS28]